jgi:DNA-binding response OmpR family regulator
MTDGNGSVCTGHKSPLSVLLVEDNSDDAALCLRVLKKAHLEIRCDVVKTQEEFVNHLHDGTYDIVLADYALGSWTGMDALNLLRKTGLDTTIHSPVSQRAGRVRNRLAVSKDQCNTPLPPSSIP